MRKNRTIRKIWYSLSPQNRFLARKLFYLPIDLADKIFGRSSNIIPPRGLIYTGSSAGAAEYIAQSKFQLELLKKYINLKPSDDILDIGSGIGRTAYALTEFLDKKSTYEGFDVVKSGVEWCKKKISSRYPNFNFIYVPLHNDLYNTNNAKASKFSFPYKENTFDKVFLFSVFTHMQPEEIDNYLSEIARVLKPGGQCLATFFTYKDESSKIKNLKFQFPVQLDGYKLMNDKVKASNVAVSEALLAQIIKKNDLEFDTLIDGYWQDTANYKKGMEFQDIAILSKKE